MATREFWLLTSYLLVALRRALTVTWIRLNKLLMNPDWVIRPVSDFRHKVRFARSSPLDFPSFRKLAWTLKLAREASTQTRRVSV